MVVKIQVQLGTTLRQKLEKNRQLALTLSAYLTPAAVLATALAFWRLGSDLNWTGRFAISRGLFSHWQVWFALAVLLQLCASRLHRHGRGDGAAMP